MADMSRRNLLGGAAAASSFMVAATGATSAVAESEQPRFGPTSRVLGGQGAAVVPLPARRSNPPTSTTAAGRRKQRSADFPVSEKLAGVLMQLSPGALRELHWHANAAEWAYVIKGRCRVTTIDPQAHSEIVDFDAGDVWYFPRGHGHSIQGLGPGDCQFILVFDNGYFSEFGTFSITDWLAHVPAEVLAKNFGVTAATFAAFPMREVYHVPKAPCRRRCRPSPRPDRSTSAPPRTAIACSPSAPRNSPAARCGWSPSGSSRSRRP